MKQIYTSYFSKPASTGTSEATETTQQGLGNNEATLIGIGVNAASELASAGLSLLDTATDAATGGIGAIIGAVTTVINGITTAVTDTIRISQQAITERRAIVADTMKGYFKLDTNKHSNLAFVIIGGVVMCGLLYIALTKKK